MDRTWGGSLEEPSLRVSTASACRPQQQLLITDKSQNSWPADKRTEKGKYLVYGQRRAACGEAQLKMLEDKQGIMTTGKERRWLRNIRTLASAPSTSRQQCYTLAWGWNDGWVWGRNGRVFLFLLVWREMMYESHFCGLLPCGVHPPEGLNMTRQGHFNAHSAFTITATPNAVKSNKNNKNRSHCVPHH